MKKRVLVVGASGGIGRAIVERLSADGFVITLHYRSNQKKAEQVLSVIEKNQTEKNLLCFDVSNRQQTFDALTKNIEQNGPFWGIVCAGGITADNPFPALSGDEWDRVLRTNLDGFYNVLSPLVMPMIQMRCGGRIVAISSLSGVIGNRGQVNYSAAEAGIIGAVKALSKELAKRDITVNSVAPGLIETELIEKVPLEEILPYIPMRRVGTVKEVAAAVAFLFSGDAGYITGQVLNVNGGMV